MAYRENPSDPIAPSALIDVATGLGLDYAEMEKQFQRAVKADPSEFSPYFAKLTYLMPKWYGSEEQMFAFARETVNNAPADSLAPLVLAKAYWEMRDRSEDKGAYFRQPRVWAEVKSVYGLLCKRFPESSERHNWFALTACLAGDYETAGEQLAIIGNNWLPPVWGSHEYFIKVKREVLRKTAPVPIKSN